MAIEIPLKGRKHTGYIAVVDDCDEDLTFISWGVLRRDQRPRVAYAARPRSRERPVELLHRVILARVLGRPLRKGELTDHINGDGLDCRRSNLRLATHAQNMANRSPVPGKSSPFLGVHWEIRKRRWCVEIRSLGRRVYRRYFSDEIKAALAYNEQAVIHHGQFARLNDLSQSTGRVA